MWVGYYIGILVGVLMLALAVTYDLSVQDASLLGVIGTFVGLLIVAVLVAREARQG